MSKWHAPRSLKLGTGANPWEWVPQVQAHITGVSHKPCADIQEMISEVLHHTHALVYKQLHNLLTMIMGIIPMVITGMITMVKMVGNQ